MGLVDKIVNEPVGGAHRDHKQMAAFLKRALNDAWRQLSDRADRKYAAVEWRSRGRAAGHTRFFPRRAALACREK